MDFIKYGFFLFILSMLVVFVVGFLVVYHIVGFPPDILETAKGVMARYENCAKGASFLLTPGF